MLLFIYSHQFPYCSLSAEPLNVPMWMSSLFIFVSPRLSWPHRSDLMWHQRQTRGILMRSSQHRPSHLLPQISVSIFWLCWAVSTGIVTSDLCWIVLSDNSLECDDPSQDAHFPQFSYCASIREWWHLCHKDKETPHIPVQRSHNQSLPKWGFAWGRIEVPWLAAALFCW